MKAPKRNHVWLFALLFGSVVTGCTKAPITSSLYVPTVADVTATSTLADLEQGRTFYLNNCGSCHSLYLPESYTPAQWRSILPGMTSQTPLTAAEIQLLTKYVSKGK
jgi:mono/diheme cytochrome c family protein